MLGMAFFALSQLTHEPPKLKTTLKTPPKQATNPLQFVKVGPCSLYRTAQEQLQKVQEVKKIKQEVRDDPEDWQSVGESFTSLILFVFCFFFFPIKRRNISSCIFLIEIK